MKFRRPRLPENGQPAIPVIKEALLLQRDLEALVVRLEQRVAILQATPSGGRAS